jgi:hypothetical protein
MQTNEIVALAAHNNALWCDAVSSTYLGPGEFHEHLWLNRFGVPRYYPDVVTLTGAEDALLQVETIAALIDPLREGEWAVKDSFQSLDLQDLGFSPLFDAEWIHATPQDPQMRKDSMHPRWRRLETEVELSSWDRAWRDANGDPMSHPIFLPRLLHEPDIRFVAILDGGALLGGAILNRGAGVVGIGNVFTAGIELETIWRELGSCAASIFPELPLVSYDRGRELAVARRAGFAPAGKLRVWRTAPTHR